MEEFPHDPRPGPAPVPDLEVHPMGPLRVPDFDAVHAEADGCGWCQCVAWWVPSWSGWGDRSGQENRRLREKLWSEDQYDGYLLYDTGKPIGWMQVGPIGRLAKLWSSYSLDELRVTPRDVAVSCVFLRPSARRHGRLHTFLRLVLEDLESRAADGTLGGGQVLAFPRCGRDHPPGDVWTGPEAAFRAAGFREIRADEGRPVLARELRRSEAPSTPPPVPESGRHTVVLFDLGGVLVDNAGIERLLEWAPDLGAEELWGRWLSSGAVRDFESGRTNAATFARELVQEFGLKAEPEDVRAETRAWIRGFYPGAERILDSLATQVRTACLSNTNEIHWDRMLEEVDLYEKLDHRFLSFRTGLLKPDDEAFTHILAALAPHTGSRPERILFLDDHPRNVEAAKRHGIDARRTVGIEAVHAELIRAGFDTEPAGRRSDAAVGAPESTPQRSGDA